MAIQFRCGCGKSYAVAESFAGKRVKCKACSAVLTVPVVPEPPADFEFVDEPAVAVKKSVKAVEVIEVDVDEDDRPVPRNKKKKKNKSAGMTLVEERELVDQLNENVARSKRGVRSVAFLICGLAIVIGCAILFIFRGDFLAISGDLMRIMVVVAIGIFALMGLAAIAKGAYGLLTGQMFGEED